MKLNISALVLALMLAAPAPFALADDERGQIEFTVTKSEAMDIARVNGMHRIDKIERDSPKWELEGCTADGREIEIDVNGQSGEIIEIDIDQDDFC